MLTPVVRSPRLGVTLVELLVAMTLAGIVLGLVSTLAFRQQRFYAGAFARLALAGELRETAVLLPVDLRAIATGAGDIRAGEARDTSLEFRATIASAIVCDISGGRVVLAPPATAGATFASLLATPQANDTTWLLATSDTAEVWRPRRITAVLPAPSGNCAAGAPTLSGPSLAAARLALTLDTLDASVRAGVPLRITRPARYSVYRASDGAWYLGQREWNPSTSRFNTIQPVTGAFLAPASGGLRFRYFDSSGAELAAGTAATPSIALVTITLAAETRRAVEMLGGGGGMRRRLDSLVLAVRPRNRR
jgi:prepilin-type N-terminal cleavage/methylation domain-containing protein